MPEDGLEGPGVDHRLNSEGHPRLHDEAIMRVVMVQHLEAGLEAGPDAVTHELPDHRVSEPGGDAFYGPPDVGKRPARPHRGDACLKAPQSAADQSPSHRIHLADTQRG